MSVGRNVNPIAVVGLTLGLILIADQLWPSPPQRIMIDGHHDLHDAPEEDLEPVDTALIDTATREI
jgi:hypothetical protein